MDKFGKEKAKARDVVKTKGAHPRGIDIHKDDEFLPDDGLARSTRVRPPTRGDPNSAFIYFGEAYIRRDAIPALLHAQRHGLCQWYLFEPTQKRKKAFQAALKAAGFRGGQINYAFTALLNGVVIPEPVTGAEPTASGDLPAR